MSSREDRVTEQIGMEMTESSGKMDDVSTSKAERKAFEIDVFRAWCKACGICAAFCPRECLALDDEGAPVVVDADRCTGCGWCELHCPDFAISVHRKKPQSRQEPD